MYTLAAFAKKKDNTQRNLLLGGAAIATGLGIAAITKRKTKLPTAKPNKIVQKIVEDLPPSTKTINNRPYSLSNNFDRHPTVKRNPKQYSTLKNNQNKPPVTTNVSTQTSNEAVSGYVRISKTGKQIQVKGFNRNRRLKVRKKDIWDLPVDRVFTRKLKTPTKKQQQLLLAEAKNIQPANMQGLSDDAQQKLQKLFAKLRKKRGKNSKFRNALRSKKAVINQLNNQIKKDGKKVALKTRFEEVDKLLYEKQRGLRNQWSGADNKFAEAKKEIDDILQEIDNIYNKQGKRSPRQKSLERSQAIQERARQKKALQVEIVSTSPNKSSMRSAAPDDYVPNRSRRNMFSLSSTNISPQVDEKIQAAKNKVGEIVRSKGEALEKASENAIESMSKQKSRRGALASLREGNKSAAEWVVKHNLKKRIRSTLLKRLKRGTNLSTPEKAAQYYRRAEKSLQAYLEKEGADVEKLSRRELFDKAYEIAKPEVDGAISKAKDYSEGSKVYNDIWNIATGNTAIDKSVEQAGIKSDKMRQLIGLIQTIGDLI